MRKIPYSRIYILLLFLIFLGACNRNSSKETNSMTSGRDSSSLETSAAEDGHILTENEIAQVAGWLRDSILSEDLDYIKTEERVFSLGKYDLNQDGKPEYFIGLLNDYFCGSGGCTYYILNNDGSVNSRFTVSHAPFQVLADQTNGWNNLIINSSEGAHLLEFDGVSYPGNPTLLPDYQEGAMLDGPEVIDTMLSEQQSSYSY